MSVDEENRHIRRSQHHRPLSRADRATCRMLYVGLDWSYADIRKMMHCSWNTVDRAICNTYFDPDNDDSDEEHLPEDVKSKYFPHLMGRRKKQMSPSKALTYRAGSTPVYDYGDDSESDGQSDDDRTQGDSVIPYCHGEYRHQMATTSVAGYTGNNEKENAPGSALAHFPTQEGPRNSRQHGSPRSPLGPSTSSQNNALGAHLKRLRDSHGYDAEVESKRSRLSGHENRGFLQDLKPTAAPEGSRSLVLRRVEAQGMRTEEDRTPSSSKQIVLNKGKARAYIAIETEAEQDVIDLTVDNGPRHFHSVRAPAREIYEFLERLELPVERFARPLAAEGVTDRQSLNWLMDLPGYLQEKLLKKAAAAAGWTCIEVLRLRTGLKRG
ncbi:hypothetical protein OE88DRAFT_1809727 [Heliocybe sulcata]|uniref:Uncharacterized protein n=1 Tax=Heliocybe sulcata TaxID=5364 RepID=A0A5C3MW90_9AGAM|nr:hypothetical protein OE88DRAFT_1809727 [Heliocybe sulcata]